MPRDYNRVMRLAPFCLMFAGALAFPAQYDPKQPLTADMILMARIRSVVSNMMTHMPNFTCVETIERSQREQGSKKYKMLDTIRLEVALVDGKELYAWPGAKKFEENDIRQMVGGSGAIGTGDFAMHAKSIFFSGNAKFDYQGTEVINSRKAHKFHFRVGLPGSRYFMQVGSSEGEVGYQGHVWNDAETLELARLEMDIDQIPPQVPLKQGYKLIEYAPRQIGTETYTMPVAMEMTLTALGGSESRNRMVFSGCRQYAGESTLIFDDPPPDTVAPKPQPVTVMLPEGLTVPLKLAAAVDLSKSAVGDTVKFEVPKNVEHRGTVLLPKGASVEMRIDLVFCRDFPTGHCFLALVPGQVSFENASGAFHAKLAFPDLSKQMDIAFANVRQELRTVPGELGQASPGASIILLRGSRGKLSSGFSTTWRTLEARGVDKP